MTIIYCYFQNSSEKNFTPHINNSSSFETSARQKPLSGEIWSATFFPAEEGKDLYQLFHVIIYSFDSTE